MAQTVSVIVSAEERVRLAAIVGDRSRPLKHVQRARIVLHSADRLPVLEVAHRRQRKPPGGLALAAALRRRRRGRAPARQDAAAGHGARADDDSRQSAGAYLRRTAGRDDPLDWARDGRCRGPLVAHDPAHLGGAPAATAPTANLQALQGPRFRREGRGHRRPLYAPASTCRRAVHRREVSDPSSRPNQPGLPLKPGKCGTMTHDYKRHGKTTLFAAFNVLDGVVLGRCMQKHTHQEFIRFLNAVERAVPAGKLIHAIVDNYATHKHPKVQAWLIRHPRWTFHFTPTSSS